MNPHHLKKYSIYMNVFKFCGFFVLPTQFHVTLSICSAWSYDSKLNFQYDCINSKWRNIYLHIHFLLSEKWILCCCLKYEFKFHQFQKKKCKIYCLLLNKYTTQEFILLQNLHLKRKFVFFWAVVCLMVICLRGSCLWD